jgi:serine/threonine protein kinase
LASGRSEQIRQILQEYRDLPPINREIFLRARCAGDEALRAEIESLIAAQPGSPLILNEDLMGLPTSTIRTSWSSLANAAQSHLGEDRFIPGATFAGRYRIVSLLGKGGMGEVYRAYDLLLKQTIALKLLPGGSRDALERFRNEVRIARHVTHPNVCRVFDIGEQGEIAFLSMEYIDGEDLASLLLRIGRLPEDKALEIAQEICAGLDAAHDKGILHRDLKPGNIMLDGRGQARITDFGLAALAEAVQGREASHGTPLYMAPEQLAGTEATARSDIYALGLILFEMFTGRRPFEAASASELQFLRATTPVPHPSHAIANLNPAIERTILRCLEADPRRRPATGIAVANALLGKDSTAASSPRGRLFPTDHSEQNADVVAPRIATALLVFIITGMLLVPLWANRIGWMSRQPVNESPEILSGKARDLASALGYSHPVDAVWSLVAPRVLKPSARQVDFWYRQAPCVFQPDQLTSSVIPPGKVGPNNPKDACEGDLNIFLSTTGRLILMRAVPPAAKEPDAADWSKLLSAAGFQGMPVRPARPAARPDVQFDSQSAWNVDIENQVVHIEAASWRGIAVYFAVGDDTYYRAATRPGLNPSIYGKRLALQGMFALLMIAFVIAGAAALVRHNLQLGRGDKQGAFLIARFMFTLSMAAWVFSATHRLTFTESTLLLAAIGWSLMMASGIWLLYMALDPYVRRRWPHTLIGFHSVIDGPARDPLIARDILFGLAAGVVQAILYNLRFQLDEFLGLYPPLIPAPPAMTSAVAFVSMALYDLHVAVWGAFFLFGLLFLLRVLLRRTWAAGCSFALLFALLSSFASHYIVVDLPLELLTGALFAIVILRWGIVSWIVASWFGPMLWSIAFPSNFSMWYAVPPIVFYALITVLSFSCYRLALPATNFITDEMLYR